MAVLKQTSPTACPVAPSPKPSITVPSASTRSAVGTGSGQAEEVGVAVMTRGDSELRCCRQNRTLEQGWVKPGNDSDRVNSNRQRSISVAMVATRFPMLRDDINNDLKRAMKARDERRVSTLRLVNSALKYADIEAGGRDAPALGDDELRSLLQKMIKQRQDAIELYERGGRAELASREREEIAIIQTYLPQQMSEDEVKTAITQAIAGVGAAGMKDMGKVIAALKGKYAGRMDFAKASALVKAALF